MVNMMNKNFVCTECSNNEFKKEYKSGNSIIYCTKCGKIITDNDLYDDKTRKSWEDRNFRPNSWDICYTNHITDYFKEASLDYSIYNEEADNFPQGYTRIPKKSEGKLSEGKLFQEGKINYEKYLKENSFKDNDETKLKYLRRYNQYEFNKCIETTGNQNILKQSDKKDIQQPKYNFEKAKGVI